MLEGTTVPHYTTGLPKLDLEPFDPTPLWEAAHSQRSETSSPTRSLGRPLLIGAYVLASLVALGAVLVIAL